MNLQLLQACFPRGDQLSQIHRFFTNFISINTWWSSINSYRSSLISIWPRTLLVFTAWRSVGRLWICSYDLLGGCGYALWSVGRLWICSMICWVAVDMLYDLLGVCGYFLWSVGRLWICSMICWKATDDYEWYALQPTQTWFHIFRVWI